MHSCINVFSGGLSWHLYCNLAFVHLIQIINLPSLKSVLLKRHRETYDNCLSLSSSQWKNTHAGGEEGTREQWRGRGWNQPKAMDEREKQRRQQQKELAPEGACQTMCPARELWDRERQNRLHRFEMLAGTERDRLPRGDPSRAVKEYSRPAAGKDSTNPSDLRPPKVLLTTVCYLIDSIAASPDLHPWTEASCSLILLFCGIFSHYLLFILIDLFLLFSFFRFMALSLTGYVV